MKYFLVLILSVFITCKKPPENGFTNKAEAENKIVDGHKEGKWVEYQGKWWPWRTTNPYSAFYVLVVYKDGQRFGLERKYTKAGKLVEIIPYIDGEKNGVAKGYYETGQLQWEAAYKDGKRAGLQRTYYLNGKMESENRSTDDTFKAPILYDTNGPAIKQK